ncbi:hypothetical protein HY041_01490 [Candidatus Roizmanbacteria bacterium]|nr:hypothetical protein [Candidatus Roizmanbacteria bacterium]
MGRIITIICIIIIAFAFFFTRLDNLDKRFSYGWDHEHLSFEVKKIVKEHKLTLLGPQANNDRGFFLGPYFTYLLVPFFLASSMHPSALIWVVVIYNIIFFLAAWYVLKKVFNSLISLAFLFLWSVNPILIGYDINPWWPLLIPLGTILYWLFLYRLDKKMTVLNLFGLGVILGILVNLHFQIFFLILFTCLFFLIHPSLRKRINLRLILTILIGFGICMVPLVLFDLRHNFLNTKLLINFFHSRDVGDKNSGLFFWIPVFTNFIFPFIHTKSIIVGVIFYGIIESIVYWLCTKKKGFFGSFYKSFFLIWLIFPFLFSLYGKRPSEYYFLFLYPFILISLIDFFLTAKKRLFLILFLTLFIFINISEIRIVMTPSASNFYYKELAIKKLKEITIQINKNYNLSFDVPLGRDVGYRYLMEYYAIQPSNNPSDPLIEIRIPPKDDDIRIGEQGIKIPKELRN